VEKFIKLKKYRKLFKKFKTLSWWRGSSGRPPVAQVQGPAFKPQK
jgi:hypothetical protein